MATTLRTFIANREGEIKEQMKELKQELRELQLAKNALGGQETAPPPPTVNTPTIKEMARAALSAADEGLTSHQILAAMRRDFGREVDRTSLSPQLSRLKDAGEITLDGDLWFTMEHWNAMQERIDDSLQELLEDWNTDEPPQQQEEPDNSIPF